MTVKIGSMKFARVRDVFWFCAGRLTGKVYRCPCGCGGWQTRGREDFS